jgi:hypothetical protein
MLIKEPIPLKMSEIQALSDNELSDYIEKLKEEKTVVRSLGKDVSAWEVELCYLLQERDTRKDYDDMNDNNIH